MKCLYEDSSTFGGQFDEARDSQVKLKLLSEQNIYKILVAEMKGEILGTITLFED